jgi:hypothetical protein
VTWINAFLNVAATAMQREDLRQRLIYAESPDELPYWPGIVNALETTAVLAIFEASFSMRQGGQWIGHEESYPNKGATNPKRSDLAFKEAGRGKNYRYVEVKKYALDAVREDIVKLGTITKRAQRWMLIYRVAKPTARRLRVLVERIDGLCVVGTRKFESFVDVRVPGHCEIVLAQVQAS